MRHLLVLDMDLLAVDEMFDLEPVGYLLALQSQEPCEVVVLSLVSTRQARMPSMQLPGTKHAVFPRAPRPDYDVSAAEHRMNLAVQQLQATGCRASGLISEEDLVKAVHSETRATSTTR